MKVFNDLVSHKVSNVWVGWIKITFSKISPKQKQTNVGYSVTNKVINSNFKNIGHDVKKEAVSAFKVNRKLLMLWYKIIMRTASKGAPWFLYKHLKTLVSVVTLLKITTKIFRSL